MNEYCLIMTGAVVVLVPAPFTRVWPALDLVLVAGVVAAAVAGYWLRGAVRAYRFRRDMRALDARNSARAAREEVPV